VKPAATKATISLSQNITTTTEAPPITAKSPKVSNAKSITENSSGTASGTTNQKTDIDPKKVLKGRKSRGASSDFDHDDLASRSDSSHSLPVARDTTESTDGSSELPFVSVP
jgi:hypothetical protein